MASLHPEIEPHDHGMLAAGDGHRLYWESCGNPAGKPALVLHGGPGSGCSAWQRRLFDPARYRVVLFDQRDAGRTRRTRASPRWISPRTPPRISSPTSSSCASSSDIDRWLVLGGSWGSTLALAYAEQHPARVTELILYGVSAGRRKEADWLFRDGLEPLFPAEWERRRLALPPELREGDVVAGYRRLLHDPDPAVRAHAASNGACGSPRRPTGRRRAGLRRGTAIRRSRSASRAS